jgi:hypothetical protein
MRPTFLGISMSPLCVGAVWAELRAGIAQMAAAGIAWLPPDEAHLRPSRASGSLAKLREGVCGTPWSKDGPVIRLYREEVGSLAPDRGFLLQPFVYMNEIHNRKLHKTPAFLRLSAIFSS